MALQPSPLDSEDPKTPKMTEIQRRKIAYRSVFLPLQPIPFFSEHPNHLGMTLSKPKLVE